jgi:hypothetical protein
MDDKSWLREKISKIEVTLAAQHVTLLDHVRRTELLEKRVDAIWLKALAVIGGLAGIASELHRLLGH